MTQEERNSWLLKNMDIITSTIHRYCERDEELDYDDTYSEIMEYLIKKLDDPYYGDDLIDIPKSRITQLVGNRIHALKKQVKSLEDPHDPSDFERIYIPDLESPITLWEFDKVPLTKRERLVFDKYITGDYNLDEIAAEFNLTSERIRQIYLRSCRKIFFKTYIKAKNWENGTTHPYYRIIGEGYIGSTRDKTKNSEIEFRAVIRSYDYKHAIFRLKDLICENVDSEDPIAVTLRTYTFNVSFYISENNDEEKIDLKYDKSKFETKKKESEEVDAIRVEYVLDCVWTKSDQQTRYRTDDAVNVLTTDYNVAAKAAVHAAIRKAEKISGLSYGRSIDGELKLIKPYSINDLRMHKVKIRRKVDK